MATLKEVRTAARELDRADDSAEQLVAAKAQLQTELDDVNTKLAAARADRDTKKADFKTLVASLT